MNRSLILCENLVKIYKVDDLEVMALQGLDLEVAQGEMLAIVGASGSGKSTLLNVLGGLDEPSAGRCTVAGYDLARMTPTERVNYRCYVIGQVWQQSGRNLIPELSLTDNVAMPLALAGQSVSHRIRRAHELLERVGLGGLRDKRPDEVSGGEQQRTAIAVALANNPTVLLADEPTGELDSTTAGTIFELLRQLNRDLELTVITVTHDSAIAAASDRTIAIRDGRTSTETIRRAEPIEGSSESRSAVIGLSGATHYEAIVIDKVGRLQLPREMFEQIPFNGRAEVRLVDGHIEIFPARQP